MLRRLMYGELQASKRNQGRPKLQYKDMVKANLQWCHIDPRYLEDIPWTDQNGEARFTELLPTSKILDARNSLLPERDTAEQPQQ